jgi:ATPase subunit of ABC transporter with duplicated ATPase domains
VGGRHREREVVSAPVLEFDSVVAGYADPVVGPVSFTLKPGEIVGLAGPNGSGKSTLLGAVMGTTRVFAGAVRRRGGLKVAVQAQVPSRLKEMPVTGVEILRITGAHRHEVPSPVRPLLPMRLDRLSGGQYQLLNVWACLGCGAELVLLDEPTNNMDPKVESSLADLLLASRAEGRALLLISHEHDFLEKVATRLIEVGR